MSRKPWHWHERQMVREHYQKMPTRELAARLGRSVGSVKKEASRLGLSGANHQPYRWTPERKRRFVVAYQQCPASAAERFGLTRMSANSYASRWGGRVRRPWTAKEDAVLRKFWPQHQDEEIAVRLDRTRAAIRCRAYKIGLRRPAIHEWMSGFSFAS